MYVQTTQRLSWKRYEPMRAMWHAWNVHATTPTTYASERGHIIHALPWGTPELPSAWDRCVRLLPLASFSDVPDRGKGLISALNYELVCGQSMPVKGNVDFAVDLNGVWVGVEIKSGRWTTAPTWKPQIVRHLAHYPRILVMMVTREAALGLTPALVLCK